MTSFPQSELMDVADVNRYLIEKIIAIGIRYDRREGMNARPADVGREVESGSPL